MAGSRAMSAKSCTTPMPAPTSSTTSTATSRNTALPASTSISKSSRRATASHSWPSCANSARSCSRPVCCSPRASRSRTPLCRRQRRFRRARAARPRAIRGLHAPTPREAAAGRSAAHRERPDRGPRYAGVNVDFEELAPRDREPFVAFMRQLRAKLQPAGLLLTESVPIEDPAYDLKQLAEVNDYLVPMVYDEHYQSGEPGPIASEAWFQKQIDRLGQIAPPSKMLIGIGNYGYDWTIGGTGSAETKFGEVMAQAASNRTAVEWDAG